MLVNQEKALEILQNGDVIIHPTDTVYGISCHYKSALGYREIFKLKKRTKDKPLGMLLSSSSQITQFSTISEEELKPLLPLLEMGVTLITSLKENLPDYIKEQSNNIALRIPNDNRVRNFLKQSGPLLSTSANISEKNPIQSHADCRKNFTAKTPFLDMENRSCLTHSTIILFKKNQYVLIREGNVKREIIEKEIPLFVKEHLIFS